MTDCVLETWRSTTTDSYSAIVIPDGCRDVIMAIYPDGSLTWHITELDSQSRQVCINPGLSLMGIRLRPGTEIAEQNLLTSLAACQQDEQAVRERIHHCCHLNHEVAESLECLRNQPKTVAQAAHWLGVTPRTLQRLLINRTGQSPRFWLQLARVRQAARSLLDPVPLVDIADIHGYADQSHLSREIKRWFGLSPKALIQDPERCDRLIDVGYD